MEACRHLDLPIPEQAIEVPKILAGAVCASRSRRQNSWWKCRRSYPTLRYAGLWSTTWTLQFLMVVEVVSVSEVFKVSQDRVQQRLVEHCIFQQRLPSRSLTLLFRGRTLHPASSSSGLQGTANQSFFAFSPRKKCDFGLALGVGTAHRVEPIHAGGSAGGFLHGCSRCVDAVSRRLVETSGLGSRSLAAWVMAGTMPSSCASLRTPLKVFPVLRARAVRTWNLVHYFLCPGLAVIVPGVWVLLRSTEIGFFGR